MDNLFKYKNFSMLTEIDIAGTFIYNGISEFNRMKTFHHTSEVFSFLYFTSVGIERLQKALLVLLSNIPPEKIKEFEKRLITHSHQDLQSRINKIKDMSFNLRQNEFLQLLTNFYKSCRYGRFSVDAKISPERDMLVDYISKHLDMDINVDGFICTSNDEHVKEFIGRVVGGIAKKYYNEIYNASSQLGIYAYELRSGSPAEKTFLPRLEKISLQEQKVSEMIAFRELLVFMLNTSEKSNYYGFLKSIEPLELDIANLNDYLEDVISGTIPQSLIDEIETLYEETNINVSDRIECLNVIGDTRYLFDIDEDEYCDDNK